MRWPTPWVLATVVLLGASSAWAEVRISMHDGRVSVVARDATVRQILAEWARVGQTRFINADRVPGGPVSIELTDVPEEQALDILLRSASGYVAAPRPIAAVNVSRFDRVLVLPTSVAPAATATQRSVSSPPAPPFPQPATPMAQPGQPPAAATDEEVEDDAQPPNGPGAPGAPPARGPVFSPFPQPQVTPQSGPLVLPPQGNEPTTVPYPGAPTGPVQGVAAPGMAVPVPQQPPQAPGRPTRPGGP